MVCVFDLGGGRVELHPDLPFATEYSLKGGVSVCPISHTNSPGLQYLFKVGLARSGPVLDPRAPASAASVLHTGMPYLPSCPQELQMSGLDRGVISLGSLAHPVDPSHLAGMRDISGGRERLVFFQALLIPINDSSSTAFLSRL